MNMKTVKVSDLIGPALDWAVAKCEGYENGCGGVVPYSTDWAQGGPVIEREQICLGMRYLPYQKGTGYTAQYFTPPHSALEVHRQYGPTPLIAALRCYIAGKFGDTIEIPEEL